ncbi:MAG: DedA family protein [Deltaproteobacteria bacterium]|nr:DedA family protein [Deltaproteobacteria bacterium]
MVHQILEAIGLWVQSVEAALGYPGVALLMGIESACIPLPSEVIMPFAGSLVALGKMNIWGVAFAGAIGCVLGSIPAYYLGAYGGRPVIEKYGKYVLLSKHDLDLADALFAKRGEWVILAARMLPVIRTFIAFPAGVVRMNMPKFIIYTFVGSLPWCLGLGYVGQKLGENWDTLRPYFHKFDALIGAVLVLGAAWWIWRHLKAARSPGASTPA